MNINEKSSKDDIISNGVEFIDSLQNENITLIQQKNILIGALALVMTFNLIF